MHKLNVDVWQNPVQCLETTLVACVDLCESHGAYVHKIYVLKLLRWYRQPFLQVTFLGSHCLRCSSTWSHLQLF